MRSRPVFAEPPAESPSTMKSSADSGSRIEQSASLPGRDVLSSALLRRVSSRAFRARAGRAIAAIALSTIAARPAGSPRGTARARVDRRLDEAVDPRVAELRLRLPLELRVSQLDRDDGGETLADVLALEVLVLLLQQPLLPRLRLSVRVSALRKPDRCEPPSMRVDVVGEREDRLLVGGVPLHRDLDGALLVLALEVDDVLVDRLLRLVDVGDEVLDPALVVELDRLAVGALVDELDAQAAS